MASKVKTVVGTVMIVNITIKPVQNHELSSLKSPAVMGEIISAMSRNVAMFVIKLRKKSARKVKNPARSPYQKPIFILTDNHNHQNFYLFSLRSNIL